MKRPLISIIAFTAIVMAGFVTGRAIGVGLIGSIIMDSPGSSMIFFSPADQFYRMYVMLNSANMFNRLTGYYSLLDNKILKSDFLIERFRNESDPAVKRTIVWVLAHAPDKKRILSFYSEAFKPSPVTIRREILKAMKKMDEKYYLRFIENVKDEQDMPVEGEYFYQEHGG